jgi:hypothetical protein
VFRAASDFKELSARQHDEIETFGRIRARGEEEDYGAAKDFLLEHWQLEDESTQGIRMLRRASNPGKRMAHGQLVGVRPADAKSFQLGQVRWLTASDDGDLHCGVKLLPGVPVAVALRALGVNVAEERYTQAFMLAQVPALEAPATLVTAAGWFKPKRVVEVASEKPMRVRLLSHRARHRLRARHLRTPAGLAPADPCATLQAALAALPGGDALPSAAEKLGVRPKFPLAREIGV